jgi:hypothetical protein
MRKGKKESRKKYVNCPASPSRSFSRTLISTRARKPGPTISLRSERKFLVAVTG